MEKETLELPVEIDFANEIEQISEYDKGRWYGRIEGAKWQAEHGQKVGHSVQVERSYSEEDIKSAFEAGHKKGFSGYPNTENWKELPFNEWFEQFKKKI